MKKSCTNVRLQEFTHKWSKTGKDVKMWNIIGEQNWEKAKVRVLLMAHWDTRPYANEDPNPENREKPILGANDGASGVAVLLELMRVLKERNSDVGIMYLMTDGEDLGPGIDEMFLGAEHFAKNLPNPKPEYGILLDMVGSKNAVIAIESNSYYYAKPLVQGFYRHAQSMGFGKTFPNRFGQAISDDHLALNAAGIPTMDLIDFENLKHWHTVTDTPENCSAESLGIVGSALEMWLLKKPPFRMPSG
jgi:glutaminyl-peptide cyclotransferase